MYLFRVSFLIPLSKWISKAEKDEVLKQVLAFGEERSAARQRKEER